MSAAERALKLALPNMQEALEDALERLEALEAWAKKVSQKEGIEPPPDPAVMAAARAEEAQKEEEERKKELAALEKEMAELEAKRSKLRR